MLNAGCEDSELARLLGLSKKKNDAVVQPQESSDNSAVENAEEAATKDSENSEAKESESKESDSQDGTQPGNPTQNGEENNSQNGTQSGNDNSTQNSEGTSDTQNNNNNSNQNSEGTSDTQNNNDSSSQSSSLPQTQAGETSDNNYKTVTIYGNRHPNDFGYAGTWEFVKASVNVPQVAISSANEFITFHISPRYVCYIKDSILFVNILFSTSADTKITRESTLLTFDVPYALLEREIFVYGDTNSIDLCLNNYNGFVGIRTAWTNFNTITQNAPASYFLNFQVPLNYKSPQEDSINTWRRTK
jgi:hypothetical protein